MGEREINNKITRREFIKQSVMELAGLTVAGNLFANRVLAKVPAAFSVKRSIVVRTLSSRLETIGGINRRILRNMIRSGFMEIASADSFEIAVKKMFKTDEIIGFKFNSYNDDLLETNTPIAEELFRLFYYAGYKPENLVFIDVELSDPTLPKPRKPKFGWSKVRDFGSGRDRFRKILYDLDAIVNVGTIMADPIGVINGCMKNVTFGFIKHPAKYYVNGYLPYIVDIYRLPEIRNKVRMNILSGIKLLLRTEQYNLPNTIVKYRSIFFSKDVVAVDSTGYEILTRFRKKASMPPLLRAMDFPPYLVYAFRKGLGFYHPDQIDLKFVSIS